MRQALFFALIGHVALVGSTHSEDFRARRSKTLEVGDVVWFSDGVGQTVTQVRRVDQETLAVVASSLAANAAEYCRKHEELKPGTAKFIACVHSNTSSKSTNFTINCRTATLVILDGSPGSASYRRVEEGQPWESSADKTQTIKGDGVFNAACGKRV